ncbi:hypothetical protein LCGC14_0943260 [marine sediment metagenome]|uniref:Uncharacterized protein n=1 Tax=marine sediment metagenome TaxID=412755 RepID=A0A0F9P5H5_9ZZZZ
MPAFSGITRALFDAKYTETADLAAPSAPISIVKPITWTSGNANRFYEETITLAATSVNRDLFGSLTDIYGNTISLVTLRALLIVNKSTTATDVLTVSGNFIATVLLSGTTPTLKLGPGGILYVTNDTDGYVVTATTADVITIDSGADTFDVDFVFIGVQ